eukprot:1161667-Pelagomonas_calceolata.AAC.13
MILICHVTSQPGGWLAGTPKEQFRQFAWQAMVCKEVQVFQCRQFAWQAMAVYMAGGGVREGKSICHP